MLYPEYLLSSSGRRNKGRLPWVQMYIVKAAKVWEGGVYISTTWSSMEPTSISSTSCHHCALSAFCSVFQTTVQWKQFPQHRIAFVHGGTELRTSWLWSGFIGWLVRKSVSSSVWLLSGQKTFYITFIPQEKTLWKWHLWVLLGGSADQTDRLLHRGRNGSNWMCLARVARGI